MIVGDSEAVAPLGRVVSGMLEAEGFVHAFFTRQGGVSRGAHATLSFSRVTGDDPAHVAENERRAARALGVPLERLYWLSQVHGDGVRAVLGSEPRDTVMHWEGDALLSTTPGVACGVRHADCVPVLLADLRSGAVAAVHAGWRGVVAGVVPRAVSALVAAVGGAAALVAAIGPHISAEQFEISEEVAAALERASDAPRPVYRGPGRPHGDLGAIVAAQLIAAGVPRASVERVGGCTVADAESWFSYRRDGPRSGRHLSAIVARG